MGELEKIWCKGCRVDEATQAYACGACLPPSAAEALRQKDKQLWEAMEVLKGLRTRPGCSRYRLVSDDIRRLVADIKALTPLVEAEEKAEEEAYFARSGPNDLF